MEERMNSTVRDLMELLSSPNDSDRTAAYESVIAMGRPAAPLLVEVLETSSSLGRWEAAKALSEISDPETAPALVRALEDEKLEVRWRATEGLAKMGVNGLKPLLQALAKDGESVPLRESAHRLLHIVAGGELKNLLLPVLTALESLWPCLEVPREALCALEGLDQFQKTHGEKITVSFRKPTATLLNQAVDLGARRRAQRYARNLRYQALYSRKPESGQDATVQ